MTDLTLVDTDVLIDVGRGIPEALSCLRSIQSHSLLAISAVTQMELIVGCRDKRELQVLDLFLSRFQKVDLNEGITEQAIDLLRMYSLSHGMQIADSLIAATAITLRLPLISKNQRHYRFIPNLNLLPYP